MVYTCNGILCSHRKKQTSDIHYNMDEPWRHYAKWKKQDIKGQIMYNSTYKT